MPSILSYKSDLDKTALEFGFLALLLASLLSVSSAARAQVEADFIEQFSYSVPLSQTAAGSFSINATLGGIESEFLLDTGASMVTVTDDLFRRIKRNSTTVKVRQVGARLASGKLELMDIYRIESISLGLGCNLGPIEVAVMDRGGRNLLGMNALLQAAPFAFSFSPPALGLSGCSLDSAENEQAELLSAL